MMPYEKLIAHDRDNEKLCHWLHRIELKEKGACTFRYYSSVEKVITEKGARFLMTTNIVSDCAMADKIDSYVKRWAPLARYSVHRSPDMNAYNGIDNYNLPYTMMEVLKNDAI